MLAHQLITKLIPNLKPSDSIENALDWMAENHLPQMVVVDNQTYLGNINEEILLDSPDHQQAIDTLRNVFTAVSCNENQHIIEVISIITLHKTACIAVLDSDQNYIGTITQHYLLEQYAQLSSLHESGSIIELEMGMHDLNLPEVTRIIANDDAKMLLHYINTTNDRLTLTIKINKLDCTTIIASLERYNYTITYHQAINTNDDHLHERYQSLIKYMEI
jgi:hypothetical protein